MIPGVDEEPKQETLFYIEMPDNRGCVEIQRQLARSLLAEPSARQNVAEGVICRRSVEGLLTTRSGQAC